MIFSEIGTLVGSLLLFLLPLGIGLWFAPVISSKNKFALPRAIIFPLAFLLGLVAITSIYVFREISEFKRVDSSFVFVVLLFLSFGGMLFNRKLFRIDNNCKKFLKILLYAFPAFAALYLIKYFYFSHYPVIDLFQMTHFMKGAEEFSKFDILNPYTADSYIPAFQVMLGTLHKNLGYDILLGMWILPFPYFVLTTLVYYGFANQMLSSQKQKIIVVVTLTIYSGVNILSNSALVELLSLSFISCLLIARTRCLDRKSIILMLFTTASVLILIVVFKWNPVYLFITIGLMLIVTKSNIVMNNGLLWGLIASVYIVLLIPMHREASFIIPLMISLVIWIDAMGKFHRLRQFMVYILPTVTVVMLGYILIKVWFNIQADPVINMLDSFIKTVSGLDISGNMESKPGLGGRIALFEMTRSLGILLAALMIAAFVSYCRNKKYIVDSMSVSVKRDWIALFLFSFGLAFVILVGLPFVHRITFFLLALLVVLWASTIRKSGTNRILLFFLPAIISIYLLVLYAKSTMFVQKYFVIFYSLLIFCVIIFIFSIIKKNYRYSSLLIILFVVMIMDRGVTTAYFQNHAFNNQIANVTAPVSHYTIHDVEIARFLGGVKSKLILVSDPHTMAIISSLTGFNKIATYSNIDSINRWQLRSLKLALSGLKASVRSSFQEQEKQVDVTSLRDYLKAFPLGAESRYFIGYRKEKQVASLLSRNKKGKENSAFHMLGLYKNQNIKIAIIWTQKTSNWLSNKNAGVPSYFPALAAAGQAKTKVIKPGVVTIGKTLIYIVNLETIIH